MQQRDGDQAFRVIIYVFHTTCPRMATFIRISLISQRLPTCTLGPLVPFWRNSKKCNDAKRGCQWWRDRCLLKCKCFILHYWWRQLNSHAGSTHTFWSVLTMSEPRAVGEGRSGYPCPCGCPFTGHPASHMVSSDLQRKKSIKGGPFSIPLCSLTIWLLSLLCKIVEAGWVVTPTAKWLGSWN